MLLTFLFTVRASRRSRHDKNNVYQKTQHQTGMKTFLKIWLFALVLYVGGVASMLFSIWPAPALREVYLYVTDNRWETQSFSERWRNDLGLVPYRLLTRDAGGAPKGDGFKRLDVANLRDRREQPQLSLSPDRKPKLTFIYGVFDFDTALHGAILIDENGKVVHQWKLAENPANLESKPNIRLYPHGVLVDPDGSVTFIFDFGTSINKVDACGKYIWSRAGDRDYNHSLERDADGSIWVPAGPPNWFDRIDPATGDILQSISMGAIIDANPDLGIFSPRSEHYAQGRKWQGDPFHVNDVEPLLPEMADAFPMFTAGDLLVSFRALNLLFVLDPETLKVKWWRQGATQQQHDPDWSADGTIRVLDNRWDNPPSKITKIDPATYKTHVMLDGGDYNFFTINRGKTQEFGSDLIVTSSKQGRVFEVDKTGKVVFDFVNTYDDKDGLRAIVSEAIDLPLNYFKDMPTCK